MNVLKEFRLAKNFNQAQAAGYLGVSKSLISHMETGRRGITKQIARKMSQDPEIGSDFPLERVLFADDAWSEEEAA